MDAVLHPIIVVFAWLWVNIHSFLTLLGMPDGPGFAWVLSIILLTVLVRVAIIPLYLKQIRSQRNMQMIQPELKKLQDKYKGKKDQLSRQRQQEEMMALYKKNNTSPFSSCLPMLVQMPVLFGLYRVIFAVEQIMNGTYRGGTVDHLGPLTATVAKDIDGSTVFGVGLSQSMGTTPEWSQRAIFIVFILVMVILQFLTMQMSMKKNMVTQTDSDNPMVRSQKTMMYLMPLMYVFTGLIFKMALIMYMVTTAAFSWAQQLWVVKVMPTPGAPAFDELKQKREASYKAWATPYFEEYDSALGALDGDEDATAELIETTLVEVKKKAKKQKVASDFPEDWEPKEVVATYRKLAVEPWPTVPDDLWMKEMVLKKTSQEAAEAARAKRPKKLSREQRLRLAERERLEQQAAERRAAKAERRSAERAKRGGDLTPEEIERRRAQRRAERRAAQRKKSQGKN